MEVKHRCNQVLELGFPLGGLAKLFAQDWEGDVTVVMPATLAQVCNIYISSLLSCKYSFNITCKCQLLTQYLHDYFRSVTSIPR